MTALPQRIKRKLSLLQVGAKLGNTGTRCKEDKT